MVLSTLNPCGASPLFHYAENNHLLDWKRISGCAIILHGVAHSSSSETNLRPPLWCGSSSSWCHYSKNFFRSVVLEISAV